MTETFPAPNYDLSPYTGWTRDHWEALLARLTYGYVLAAERYGSPARALFPDDRRGLPDSVDALESFARMASAWGAWLRNPANPATLRYGSREIDLEDLLHRALLEGTDPGSPHTYWGDMHHLSQHIVEAADVAVTVWLSRERVFSRMSEAERAQVMTWLAQVDGKETYFDNWILFPAMATMVRLKLGYPASEADLDSRLEQISAFYRGDGWYVDGAGDEFDLYNAWIFGWHYLLWAWIDGGRRPDHSRLVLERARSFLAGFQHFFGANGSYPAWGRSIVYRFGAVAAFATGYLLNVAPPRPGLLRRISSGCIRYFCERGLLDPDDHYIRQGFHGDFPPAGESYISPGSPYWACHGFFALTFDRDDPFWTATESPLPVEQYDFDLALPAPGFVLSGRRATGQVLLLNARSGQRDEIEPDAGGGQLTNEAELIARFAPRHDYPAKYGKFAYSTHLPFNVAPVPGSYAPDAMLSLSRDGLTFGHRSATRAGGVAPGMMWCEFDEVVDKRPQTVRVAVLLWKDLQIRLAFIQPTVPVRAFEAPGALGCDCAADIVRRSDPSAGWEYAQVDGRALAIRRLLGYDSQRASAPFLGYSNINLAYPYAEQPLVCETQPGGAPRHLAAMSLVRPAPFDPAREFANFEVSTDGADSFRLVFPDGEIAFVALGNEPPRSVELGDTQVEGIGLRCVRLASGASDVRGMGLSRLAGIAEFSTPATLRLRREANGAASVITDTGVSLSTEWLGGAIRRAEVKILDGGWADVSEQCGANSIPTELVRHWSQRNERQLVEFCLRL